MYDYDSILNGRLSRQRHEQIIREVQDMRLVRMARGHNQRISHRIATPVRRAVHLVTALIR